MPFCHLTGLSRTTFYRKLLEIQSELAERGVTRNQQLLPPDVVEYICPKVRINPASTGIRLSKKKAIKEKKKAEKAGDPPVYYVK